MINHIVARFLARWATGVCLLLAGLVHAQTPDDQFAHGYATSVLEQQFKIHPPSLAVHEGTVTMSVQDLGDAERDEVQVALERIPGVRRVVFLENGATLKRGTATVANESTTPEGGEFLPAGHLFRPLMADQRWPHFSAIWQVYQKDDELRNVGAVSLGATIPLYENNFWGAGRWSLGAEAVVFSVFDLDTKSRDLVNSDYLVGIPFSYAHNGFSAVARAYHQSSHLGDEYLLRNPVTRIDLSYEAIDLRLSRDFFDKLLRLYGGGGYIVDKTPNTLEPWSAQWGIELRSPRTIFNYFRPVAALDMQTREETDWDLDWSARVGVQLDAERLQGRTLQLLFEYFQGHSPNGQFYERSIEYVGLGIHFYL